MNFSNSNDSQFLVSFSHSSLTDVVFLLLIFFLLTSSFIISYGIQIDPPDATSSSETDPNQVVIIIDPKGFFYIKGRRVPKGAISQMLHRLVAEEKITTFIIRSDKVAPIGSAVYIMNIASLLNVSIFIATDPTADL